MVIRINPKMANGLEVKFSAREVSVFGVFLVRILSHSDWIWTRKTPNTDTFHAVFATSVPFFGQEKLWRLCIFPKYGIFGLDSLAAALQMSLGKDFTIFLMVQRISHFVLLVSFFTP